MTKKDQEHIFKEWIEEFKPLLFKIVKVYSNNLSDENDLFQEIIIQIWKSILNFKNRSSVHTWIYKVALNTAIKWSTKNKNRKQEELKEDQLLLTPTPQDNSNLEWLYGEIAKLDTLDKSLTLLMLDGFSYKEMAGILGITTSNVGVKINRIKSHLQKQSKITQP
ncbi:MAG: sigma-70 family RNA polymerase sigma factor [Saprospiraceae bacterium]|nr:sigma-70 family RNA polymerase sigma factor [Saprospiraceae bacterium]